MRVWRWEKNKRLTIYKGAGALGAGIRIWAQATPHIKPQCTPSSVLRANFLIPVH